MEKNEIKICCYIALVFSLRIFGLMLILPVISLYIDNYQGSSELMLGLVVGSYGIVQALLQVPLGMISDKIGRTKVIIFGLSMLAIGSFICFLSTSVYGLIIGRAISGAGAIGSTLLAALSDNTSSDSRTKAMAILGAFIGISFFVSLLLAPVAAVNIGFKQMFLLVMFLSLLALLFSSRFLPKKLTPVNRNNIAIASMLPAALLNKQLWIIYFGIWVLHAVYTALFLKLPEILLANLNLSLSAHSGFYMLTLGLSVLLVAPALMLVEKKSYFRYFFSSAIFIMAISLYILSTFNSSFVLVSGSMVLYFASFCLLESLLPSLASRYAPIACRGTVMGVFSSMQFFGIFSGSLLVGLAGNYAAKQYVILLLIFVLLIWLLASFKVHKPVLVEKIYDVKNKLSNNEVLRHKLLSVSGVNDVFIAEDEQKIYIKLFTNSDAKKILDRILES